MDGARSLPLERLVGIDFSWAVSGPQGTRLLADWGAQVYRFEWPQSLDLMRGAGAAGTDTPRNTSMAPEASLMTSTLGNMASRST